jgi:hypothetical protein
MLGLEGLGELADAVFDGAAPRGPSVDEFFGEAVDFADGSLAWVAGGGDETHSQRRDQMSF